LQTGSLAGLAGCKTPYFLELLPEICPLQKLLTYHANHGCLAQNNDSEIEVGATQS
jgi:hypothetical protein